MKSFLPAHLAHTFGAQASLQLSNGVISADSRDGMWWSRISYCKVTALEAMPWNPSPLISWLETRLSMGCSQPRLSRTEKLRQACTVISLSYRWFKNSLSALLKLLRILLQKKTKYLFSSFLPFFLPPFAPPLFSSSLLSLSDADQYHYLIDAFPSIIWLRLY